jgi:corrinoid protein of di/trimethylamine methyltransferase
MNQKALIEHVVKAILSLDENKVNELIQKAFDEKVDLTTLVNDGITVSLRKLGDRFEDGKVFLPELMKGAMIVQHNMKFLEPHIKRDELQTKGKFVIGTVAGDLHDVGKNIICTVFSAAGYEVIDLGIDVSTETFVEKVKEERPKLLGLSALLTTTMMNQREVIEALKAEGLRGEVKILVGGAPVSGAWAKKINADGYGEDVFSGLKKAEQLLGQ